MDHPERGRQLTVRTTVVLVAALLAAHLAAATANAYVPPRITVGPENELEHGIRVTVETAVSRRPHPDTIGFTIQCLAYTNEYVFRKMTVQLPDSAHVFRESELPVSITNRFVQSSGFNLPEDLLALARPTITYWPGPLYVIDLKAYYERFTKNHEQNRKAAGHSDPSVRRSATEGQTSLVRAATHKGAVAGSPASPAPLQEALEGGSDLQPRWWPTVTADKLQSMQPTDVATVQIFGLEWPQHVVDEREKERLARKAYTEAPLTQEDNGKDIEALLTVVKRAGKWTPPGKGVPYASSPPDRVLVVRPKAGEPFEVLYSSALHEPFGNLYSRALKETLHALTAGATFTVIRLDNGEVQKVVWFSVIAPHRGSSNSSEIDADMHLVPTGVSLHVRMRDADKIVIDDEKPMHYGDAKVFRSTGSGTCIVLLHEP